MITQKEKVARYLVEQGTWVPSYELVKAKTSAGYTGLQADRRAFELVKEGFESSKARYTFESERRGKYTYFRVKERIEKGSYPNKTLWESLVDNVTGR